MYRLNIALCAAIAALFSWRLAEAATAAAPGSEQPRLVLESTFTDGNVRQIYIDKSRLTDFAKIEVLCAVDNVDNERRVSMQTGLKWRIRTGQNVGASRIDLGRQRLTIQSPQQSDPTDYECVYEDGHMRLSANLSVIFNDDAHIESVSLADVRAAAKAKVHDHEVRLRCGTRVLTEADHFEWSVDGVALPELDDVVKYEHNGDKRGELARSGTDESRAGVYRCRVVTQTGHVRNHLTRVISAPALRASSRSKNVVEGETFSIECLAFGSPRPRTIVWLRRMDNETEFTPHIPAGVKKGYSSEGMPNGRLLIANVTKADRAEYNCTARNEYGTAAASIMVRVKDKYAALWPFFGIIAEVLVLICVIFVFERRQAAKRRREDELEQNEAKKSLTTPNESRR